MLQRPLHNADVSHRDMATAHAPVPRTTREAKQGLVGGGVRKR